MLVAGAWIFIAALSLSSLYPLVFVVNTSFKTSLEYAVNNLGLPAAPTTEWYVQLFRDDRVFSYLLNSILIVVASVVIVLIVSTLAATALALMRFKLRRLSYLALVSIMFFPASVQIVPIFLTVNYIGLLNNYFGLVLVYAALYTPFATYLLASYLENLPAGLIEAAECDGASPLTVVWRIVVPLTKPLLGTLGVLMFLWLWNDLLFALLILQREEMRTLTVSLALVKGAYPEVPQLAAVAFVSMVPPLLAFAMFHRNVVSGISAGGLK